MLELVVKYRKSDEVLGCVEYIRVLLVDSISRWHSAYRTRRDPGLPPPRVSITSLHVMPAGYLNTVISSLLVLINAYFSINPRLLNNLIECSTFAFSVPWLLSTASRYIPVCVVFLMPLPANVDFCLVLQVFKEERLDRMQVIRLINLVADAGWLPQPLASTIEIIEIIDGADVADLLLLVWRCMHHAMAHGNKSWGGSTDSSVPQTGVPAEKAQVSSGQIVCYIFLLDFIVRCGENFFVFTQFDLRYHCQCKYFCRLKLNQPP